MAEQKRAPPNEERDIMIACVLFTAVGVGYLFPFSALTQPVDYWHNMFPDFNIEFPLTTMYMWVNLIFLFLIVFFGGEPSYTVRIVGGFVGQLLVLIAVPSFYFLHMDEYTHYTMIMIATAMAAITTAFVDSVAIGFAAQFPTRIQEALQFGIGFSTFIGSLYRVITKLVFPVDQVVESSLLYFYSGAATIMLCIYAYYYILSLPLAKRCLSFGVDRDTSEDEDSANLLSRDAEAQSVQLQSRSKAETGYGSIDQARGEGEITEGPINKWVLLRKVAFSEFIVFVLFFSTLLLWPPLITEIKSFNFPELQASQWWPLILLMVFSSSDWLTSSNIWVAVLARFALFPLIVCSAKGIYFTHDLFSVLFVFLLGFTNGYLGSLAILFVNEQVSEKEAGLVGTFTGFFLNLGLVFGATCALGVEQWVLQK